MSQVVILKRPVRANGGLNGIGSRLKVPDRYAQALIKQGAAVPYVEQPKAAPEPKPLSKKTKAELVALAEERGLDGAGDATKAELVELLSE